MVNASFEPPVHVEGYLPIEDHGLIGDGATAVLAGQDGAISWLCVPRFDSPPLFCAIYARPPSSKARAAPSPTSGGGSVLGMERGQGGARARRGRDLRLREPSPSLPRRSDSPAHSHNGPALRRGPRPEGRGAGGALPRQGARPALHEPGRLRDQAPLLAALPDPLPGRRLPGRFVR